MKNVITYETLRYFAYSNDQLLGDKPIRGIVLSFYGLGNQQMLEDSPYGATLAKDGILLLIPYNNPWAWMNPQAVAYTDELVNVLIKRYNLPEDIPIVSSGGSMGGQSAIVYARYAQRTPVACVVNCPACDLLYHYTERPDVPRTLYSAFFHAECDRIEDALKQASPLHLVSELPVIPYYIFHCEQDQSVKIEKHSLPFVQELKKRCPVTFHKVPGRGHCDLTEEMDALYHKYIIDSIKTAGLN